MLSNLLLRSSAVQAALALAAVSVVIAGCDCAGPAAHEPRTHADAASIDDAATLPVEDGGPIDPCGDGFDGDMDGNIDEGCRCEAGSQQWCFHGDPALAGVGACIRGVQNCASGIEFGTWDMCTGAGMPSAETCNGVDDNCDGVVDEGCDCTTGATRSCYTGTTGSGTGLCHDGVETCVATASGSMWSGDCSGEIAPSAEDCDGLDDEDCDGLIDEGCTCDTGTSRDCYGGPASTRDHGLCHAGTQTCAPSGWGACSGDVVPGTELCTGGIDEDCDGLVDCADSACSRDSACCSAYDETVPVVPSSTELLFVVDRSGSMDFPASGTTNTRWVELENAMTSVLPSLSDLPLGLYTFPLLDGTSELHSCAVSSMVDIGIATGTSSAISARLVAADPRGGDTPTPQAFATVQSYNASHPTSLPRFVVLATDGLPEPNCGGATVMDQTVAAITALRSAGIDTFVLGFVGPDRTGDTSGIPALQAALNTMADAGGRARSGSLHYYEAVDGAAFERSLRAILASATDCGFDLASAPSRPTHVIVRQNGLTVPAANWTITGSHLQFTGLSCEAIRSGSVTSIRVTDTCS